MSDKKYIDYLDEDPEIRSQKYFILSYLLPTSEGLYPAIKIRGCYSSKKECEHRIKKLQAIDPNFHMYICEVGKWGSLVPDEYLLDNSEAQINYQNNQLNDMMRDYKQNREEANREFEYRKNEMINKAKYDGTPEGQEQLLSQKESPIAVKDRIVYTDEKIKLLQQQLQELIITKEKAEEKFASYSETEIKQAEEHIKKYKEQYNIK